MIRRALPVFCALFLTACPASGPDKRGPKDPAPAPPVARAMLTMDGGALGLKATEGKIDPHTPLFVMDAGAWPKGGTDRTPPITAVVTQDGAGKVWILHDRRGSSLKNAQVVSAVPATSLYPRPAATRGLPEGKAAQAGDQAVIVSHSDGPPMRRLIGAGRYDGQSWTFTNTDKGKGLAVRVGWLPAEIQAEDLGVSLQPGDCKDSSLKTLRASLTKAIEAIPNTALVAEGGDARIALTPVGCNAPAVRLKINAALGEKLLRTPFWNPSGLSVALEGLDIVTAVVAGFRGERATALMMTQSMAIGDNHRATLVAAALALEVGWSTDAIALLEGASGGPETALIRAGALYQLGAYEAALAALDGAPIKPSVDGRTDLGARLVTARAALMLAMRKPGDATVALDAAIAKASDADRATLQLARSEVLLAKGDPKGFDMAIAEVAKDANISPTNAVTLKRYQAMLARMKGEPDTAMTLYKEGVIQAKKVSDWRQAVIMSLFHDEIAAELRPDLAGGMMVGAEEAARMGFDASSWGEVVLARWESYAVASAGTEADVSKSESLMKNAIEAARGVDRLDREARARRYGLLTMSAQADITFKAGAIKDALVPALASRELVEATILFSLLAQIEAARFRFEIAEDILAEAYAFAATTGDKDLMAMISAEREALKQ